MCPSLQTPTIHFLARNMKILPISSKVLTQWIPQCGYPTPFTWMLLLVLTRIHWTSNQVYVSNPNQIMVAYWSGDGDFSATLYMSYALFWVQWVCNSTLGFYLALCVSQGGLLQFSMFSRNLKCIHSLEELGFINAVIGGFKIDE